MQGVKGMVVNNSFNLQVQGLHLAQGVMGLVVLHINLLVMGSLVQKVKGKVVRSDLNFKPKGLCLVQEGLHLV